MTIQVKIKGVSDLKKFMDYFSLPGKRHENFPDYIILKDNTSICQNFFLEIWVTFTTGSQLILTGSHDARTVSLGQWLFTMQWGSGQFRWSCNYCTKIRLDKFFVHILRRSHKKIPLYFEVSTQEIFSKFVAFSQYLNFTLIISTWKDSKVDQ